MPVQEKVDHYWIQLTYKFGWCRVCGCLCDKDDDGNCSWWPPGESEPIHDAPPCRPETARQVRGRLGYPAHKFDVRDAEARLREAEERVALLKKIRSAPSLSGGSDYDDEDISHALAVAQERVDNPAFVLKADPGTENLVRDHVAETMGRRADLIDVLALRYGTGFQLVEQRSDDGLKTTWHIERR